MKRHGRPPTWLAMEGRRIAGLRPLTDADRPGFPPATHSSPTGGLPQPVAPAARAVCDGASLAAFSLPDAAAVTVGAKAGAILNPGERPAPAFDGFAHSRIAPEALACAGAPDDRRAAVAASTLADPEQRPVPVFHAASTILLLKAIGLHEGFGQHDLAAIVTHCACRAAQDIGLGVLARDVSDADRRRRRDAGPLERVPP